MRQVIYSAPRHPSSGDDTGEQEEDDAEDDVEDDVEDNVEDDVEDNVEDNEAEALFGSPPLPTLADEQHLELDRLPLNYPTPAYAVTFSNVVAPYSLNVHHQPNPLLPRIAYP